MAPNGPPDDNFHEQRTQYRNYGGPGAPPPPGEPAPLHEEMPTDQGAVPEAVDPFEQEDEPTPWYRKPAGIIAWIVAVLILIALIVYGLMQLIQGGGGSGNPSTSTSTTPTTVTTSPTTTPPTSTTTTEPPGSSPEEPPAQPPVQQPTQQPTRQPNQQPPQQQPTHRHHLPSLPSVITIPEGPVVTLPQGIR